MPVVVPLASAISQKQQQQEQDQKDPIPRPRPISSNNERSRLSRRVSGIEIDAVQAQRLQRLQELNERTTGLEARVKRISRTLSVADVEALQKRNLGVERVYPVFDKTKATRRGSALFVVPPRISSALGGITGELCQSPGSIAEDGLPASPVTLTSGSDVVELRSPDAPASSNEASTRSTSSSTQVMMTTKTTTTTTTRRGGATTTKSSRKWSTIPPIVLETIAEDDASPDHHHHHHPTLKIRDSAIDMRELLQTNEAAGAIVSRDLKEAGIDEKAVLVELAPQQIGVEMVMPIVKARITVIMQQKELEVGVMPLEPELKFQIFGPVCEGQVTVQETNSGNASKTELDVDVPTPYKYVAPTCEASWSFSRIKSKTVTRIDPIMPTPTVLVLPSSIAATRKLSFTREQQAAERDILPPPHRPQRRKSGFVLSLVAGLERNIQAGDEPEDSTPKKVFPIAHAEVVEVQAENTKDVELDDVAAPVESAFLWPIANAITVEGSEIHSLQSVSCIPPATPIIYQVLCGVVCARSTELDMVEEREVRVEVLSPTTECTFWWPVVEAKQTVLEDGYELQQVDRLDHNPTANSHIFPISKAVTVDYTLPPPQDAVRDVGSPTEYTVVMPSSTATPLQTPILDGRQVKIFPINEPVHIQLIAPVAQATWTRSARVKHGDTILEVVDAVPVTMIYPKNDAVVRVLKGVVDQEAVLDQASTPISVSWLCETQKAIRSEVGLGAQDVIPEMVEPVSVSWVVPVSSASENVSEGHLGHEAVLETDASVSVLSLYPAARAVVSELDVNENEIEVEEGAAPVSVSFLEDGVDTPRSVLDQAKAEPQFIPASLDSASDSNFLQTLADLNSVEDASTVDRDIVLQMVAKAVEGSFDERSVSLNHVGGVMDSKSRDLDVVEVPVEQDLVTGLSETSDVWPIAEGTMRILDTLVYHEMSMERDLVNGPCETSRVWPIAEGKTRILDASVDAEVSVEHDQDPRETSGLWPMAEGKTILMDVDEEIELPMEKDQFAVPCETSGLWPIAEGKTVLMNLAEDDEVTIKADHIPVLCETVGLWPVAEGKLEILDLDLDDEFASEDDTVSASHEAFRVWPIAKATARVLDLDIGEEAVIKDDQVSIHGIWPIVDGKTHSFDPVKESEAVVEQEQANLQLTPIAPVVEGVQRTVQADGPYLAEYEMNDGHEFVSSNNDGHYVPASPDVPIITIQPSLQYDLTDCFSADLKPEIDNALLATTDPVHPLFLDSTGDDGSEFSTDSDRLPAHQYDSDCPWSESPSDLSSCESEVWDALDTAALDREDRRAFRRYYAIVPTKEALMRFRPHVLDGIQECSDVETERSCSSRRDDDSPLEEEESFNLEDGESDTQDDVKEELPGHAIEMSETPLPLIVKITPSDETLHQEIPVSVVREVLLTPPPSPLLPNLRLPWSINVKQLQQQNQELEAQVEPLSPPPTPKLLCHSLVMPTRSPRALIDAARVALSPAITPKTIPLTPHNIVLGFRAFVLTLFVGQYIYLFVSFLWSLFEPIGDGYEYDDPGYFYDAYGLDEERERRAVDMSRVSLYLGLVMLAGTAGNQLVKQFRQD
ncbi:hypothetical protein DFS34DRAFT_655172 [Phlyctochytrium arcticum]|nr:hypothetical protein DFS34DRAFT_655172 [Phlyctochytrium arcticum]